MRKGGVEICLNLQTGKFTDIEMLCNQVEKVRRSAAKNQEIDPEWNMNKQDEVLLSDYNSFLQSLDLLSECCLGRNSENQLIIEKYYELKTT